MATPTKAAKPKAKGLESTESSPLTFSSPFEVNSDQSWSGIHFPSPPSYISRSPSFAPLAIHHTHRKQLAYPADETKRSAKELLEVEDLTSDSLSPTKDQRRKRLSSLILLSLDDDKSPTSSAKWLRPFPSATAPQVAAQRGPKGQGKQHESTHTIIISSDSESSDSTPANLPPRHRATPPPAHGTMLSVSAQPLPTCLAWGTEYDSLELAEAAVKQDAEAHGFVMVRGQSLRNDGGLIQKLTMRCKCYRQPVEQHDLTLHPSDHREGKSFRTACLAHVNIRQMTGTSSCYLSLVDAHHNHPRILPTGGHAQSRPTEQQWQFITKYQICGAWWLLLPTS